MAAGVSSNTQMQGMDATHNTTIALLHAQREPIARQLHAELGRRFSRDDVDDAVADVVTAALADAPAVDHNPAGWLRVAARRRLLDEIKRQDGRFQDGHKRQLVSTHDQAVEALLIARTDVEDDPALADSDVEALRQAFAALSPNDQWVLARTLDGLSQTQIAELAGTSRKSIENTVRRGTERLRTAFLNTEASSDCGPARIGLFLAGRDHAVRARVIAHLETCAACRAFEKRRHGLLLLSPLPLFTFRDRLVGLIARSASSTPLPSGRTGELAGGAAAAFGGGKALLACGTAVTVAACGLSALAVSGGDPAPPANASQTRPARVAAAPTPTPIATAVPVVSRDARPVATAAPIRSKPRRPARAARPSPTPAPSAPEPPVASAPSKPAPQAPELAPSSSSRSSDSFSQEFSP